MQPVNIFIFLNWPMSTKAVHFRQGCIMYLDYLVAVMC